MEEENLNKEIKELINLDINDLSRYFKEVEAKFEQIIKPPLIIRLDGVGFGRKLLDYLSPRDEKVHTSLISTVKEFMKLYSNSLAYITSDEINLLFLNIAPYNSRLQKLISITSGFISSKLSLSLKKQLYFDARVIKVESLSQIAKYFKYRMRIGFNNFISKLYHKYFKVCETPNLPNMLRILKSRGVELNKFPTWMYLGSYLIWEIYEKRGYNPISKTYVITMRRRINRIDRPINILKYLEYYKKFKGTIQYQ